MIVPAERLYNTYLKRYKWAFLPKYAQLPDKMPTMPDYDDFATACEAELNVNC